MTDYDAIVIGAGHNGLACGAYLAKAGRRVLMLEADADAGGCATTREFAPGYRVSSCAQWVNQLNPKVMNELALASHGLSWAARDLDSIGLDPNGECVNLGSESVSGMRISSADRAAFKAFRARMGRFAGLLAGLFDRTPPRLVNASVSERLELAQTGLRLRRLGRDDMREFLRIGLMNCYDLLNEHFASDHLKGVLAIDAVLGGHLGPRSPSTVFTLLYRMVGEAYGFAGPAQPRGGAGALGQALQRAALALGAELRCGARVASVELANGRASGVLLDSGERIGAGLVVSAIDPATTLQQLVGYRQLETGTARRVHGLRFRGNAAKLHLALDALPEFTGVAPERLGQRLVIAPSMDYLETAFNHAKYGEYSPEPAMDISLPSVNDPDLAPDGRHVLSAIVQFAPCELQRGWDGAREDFMQRCLAVLERHAPGLRDLVSASELLTPADLRQRHGMAGGHWHHAELTLDQFMFTRPFPGASQYLSPVDGLYLCSAGTHPGGGLSGTCGRNAARQILKREDSV
jgi:phytoene dehydrogenase-like protein